MLPAPVWVLETQTGRAVHRDLGPGFHRVRAMHAYFSAASSCARCQADHLPFGLRESRFCTSSGTPAARAMSRQRRRNVCVMYGLSLSSSMMIGVAVLGS